MSYLESLTRGLAAGKHLCVGIDPHSHLLEQWGLEDTPAGAERMGREVVAAAHDHALALKPQIAFFERFGSAGYVALERVLEEARQAKLLTIADVKRGDIGSSFAAYADAWLQPGSPLECDAMTVVAYQGFGSLDHALDLVRAHDKGLFVLAATSNPEARATQQAKRDDNLSIAASIVKEADVFNGTYYDQSLVGPVGVVLGATLNLADFEIGTDASARKSQVPIPVLAPGFGAQGAQIEDAQKIFGGLAWALIANESRGLLQEGAEGLAKRIESRSHQIKEALRV